MKKARAKLIENPLGLKSISCEESKTRMAFDFDSIIDIIDFEDIREHNGEIVIPVSSTEIQLDEEHYVVLKPKVAKSVRGDG